MTISEEALCFECQGESMIGVLSQPETPSRSAVIVVVGGPQTRVGSHRQFVLLARALAGAGIACLRFDYRGIGDSEGDPRNFEVIDEDISAAHAALRARLPDVQYGFLWGLCDGATAALFHAARGADIAGLILLNPWVRTEQGEAAALVANYYRGRLLSWDFWRKLLGGGLDIAGRLREFRGHWGLARSRARKGGEAEKDLPARFAKALRKVAKPVLLVLSGRDLTAAEFRNAVQKEPLASALASASVAWHEIAAANHTFSSALWREEVERASIDFVRRIERAET